MTGENNMYKRVIKTLRDSRPELIRPDDMGNEVLSRIRNIAPKKERITYFTESLFGWVYIGWVRRSLVGAAVILVSVFIYQQVFILKQVKTISEQVVILSNGSAQSSAYELDNRLTFYKIPAGISSGRDIRISQRRLKELLESYESLELKYRDLLRIIEEDPELKKYIEKKLIEENSIKPDI